MSFGYTVLGFGSDRIPMAATGGTITNSGAYTIHTFTGSGTFTPSRAGSVDYLVVAGGAAGGSNHGGGGGAGGFRTATDYPVALLPQQVEEVEVLMMELNLVQMAVLVAVALLAPVLVVLVQLIKVMMVELVQLMKHLIILVAVVVALALLEQMEAIIQLEELVQHLLIQAHQ